MDQVSRSPINRTPSMATTKIRIEEMMEPSKELTYLNPYVINSWPMTAKIEVQTKSKNSGIFGKTKTKGIITDDITNPQPIIKSKMVMGSSVVRALLRLTME